MVTIFVASDDFAVDSVLRLGAEHAQHLRARRVTAGSRICLVNGRGTIADGTLTAIERRDATVTLDEAHMVPRPAAVHLIVPVADRDRMLWLAEKCTELGASSWRPVLWQRSRSVSPRGEGPAFLAKVAARMGSALEQSGGAWLPDLHKESTLNDAIAEIPDGSRLLLDPQGEPIVALPLETPVTIATGPEGGVECEEREALVAAGFRPVTLGAAILRFETAAIAALAIVQARLARGTA